jgi:hypothetical protein
LGRLPGELGVEVVELEPDLGQAGLGLVELAAGLVDLRVPVGALVVELGPRGLDELLLGL